MKSHGKYRVNQSMRSFPGIAIGFLLVLVLPVSTLLGDEAKTSLPPASERPQAGSIEGKVIYQADGIDILGSDLSKSLYIIDLLC